MTPPQKKKKKEKKAYYKQANKKHQTWELWGEGGVGGRSSITQVEKSISRDICPEGPRVSTSSLSPFLDSISSAWRGRAGVLVLLPSAYSWSPSGVGSLGATTATQHTLHSFSFLLHLREHELPPPLSPPPSPLPPPAIFASLPPPPPCRELYF